MRSFDGPYGQKITYHEAMNFIKDMSALSRLWLILKTEL